MSEHEKQTAFLRQCLVYDESAERQELDKGIARILRDERCLRRAMGVMAFVMALTLAILGYAAVLPGGYLQNVPPLLLRLLGALGLASLVSLLCFGGLRIVYRQKLNERRDACRRLTAGLLESRLGKPRTSQVPEFSRPSCG